MIFYDNTNAYPKITARAYIPKRKSVENTHVSFPRPPPSRPLPMASFYIPYSFLVLVISSFWSIELSNAREYPSVIRIHPKFVWSEGTKVDTNDESCLPENWSGLSSPNAKYWSASVDIVDDWESIFQNMDSSFSQKYPRPKNPMI